MAMVPHTDMTWLTALILCGGRGSRLRLVIGDLPKVLAPVAGRPFLHYVLHYLRSQDISDVVLCTGYGAEQVLGYCKDGSPWDLHIRDWPEAEQLGTGGAIKHAQFLIASNPFLVLNGDSLVRADLHDLVTFHTEKQARITMILTEVPDKMRFGSVVLASDGSIAGFSEKGSQGAGLINAGIYLMDRAVLEAIPTGRNVSIERDVFPRFMGKGLYGMVTPGPFIDIGTPEAYAMAQTDLASGPERG